MKLPGTPAAALFDVDGTLVDSVPYEAAAWLDALRSVDAGMTLDRVLKQIGKGADHLLPALLQPEMVDRHGKQLDELQGRIFHEKYQRRVRAFPGVRPVFVGLREAGTKTALVSSGDQADIAHYARLTGICDLVDFIVSADDVEHSKPSADLFLAARARLKGIAAAEIIAIGDTPYDAEAAAQAGIATIGVTCGGAFQRQELRDGGCITVCSGPDQLMGLFELRAA
jgi:HAD superfamily hydrolase (TIGR01549 family)